MKSTNAEGPTNCKPATSTTRQRQIKNYQLLHCVIFLIYRKHFFFTKTILLLSHTAYTRILIESGLRQGETFGRVV